MSNTITFHRINHIIFSGAQKQVRCVDMVVDGYVHTITAGDFVDAILVDEGNVFFYGNSHFYIIPDARIYDERLSYSFSLAD
jgi:hypothetical protein